MKNQKIDEMSIDTFDAIVERFIARETQDLGELPAEVFYETLEIIFQKPAEAMTVALDAQVVGDELQFALPDIALPGIAVHNNEIMVNNVRFVVRLSPTAVA